MQQLPATPTNETAAESGPDALRSALAEMLDHEAITRVVNNWGLFRDTGRWEQLRALYATDAVMYTTWFVGAAMEFVERSIEAKKRGSKVQHFICASTICLHGDRAVAETRMILLLRASVADVPVDVTCYGRFHDRLVRERGAWRIKLRVPVYEKDRIDPVLPGQAVLLNQATLSSFAEGYRHLAYVQSLSGAALTPGLPTANSKEEATLCAEAAAWLSEKS